MFKNTLNIIILAGLLVLVLNEGCGNNPGKNKTKVKPEPVEVTKVVKETISENRTYAGTLEGIEQSAIVSKIGERVTKVNVSVNDFVKKGDIIVQLDRSGATSNYLQAKANFENAKKNYERMKALYEDGAISRQQLDQAETAYQVAKADFDASSSTVDLESPINGLVTDLNVNAGDWVNPGTQLATIANIKQMIAKFYVTESEIGKINISDPVTIYSEFNKERSVKGKITEISRSASSDARSFQIKARFSNTRNDWYKPGMFVKVDLTLASQKNVLVIPTDAVVFTNDKDIVYKIVNNIAIPVDVTIGLTNENITEITRGLKEGDVVVTAGMNNLSDSTAVSIIR